MSNDKNNTTVSLGVFFLPALTLMFVYFKLSGGIDWSWFWVLSPVLFPIILLTLIVAIATVFAIASEIVGKSNGR